MSDLAALPASTEPQRCIVTGKRAPGGSPFCQRLTANAAGIAAAKARGDAETLAAAEVALRGEFGAQAWGWLSDPEAAAAEVARREGRALREAQAALQAAQTKVAALTPPAPVLSDAVLSGPVASVEEPVAPVEDAAEPPADPTDEDEPDEDEDEDEDKDKDKDEDEAAALGRSCPTCGVDPGEVCLTGSGNPATRAHAAR